MITDNVTIAEKKFQFDALGVIFGGGKKSLLHILR
jgi:hypothetical protein